MTKTDVIKILAILKAAYPNSYKNQTNDEAQFSVNVYWEMLKEYDAPSAVKVVRTIIKENTFAPSIAEIINKIKENEIEEGNEYLEQLTRKISPLRLEEKEHGKETIQSSSYEKALGHC